MEIALRHNRVLLKNVNMGINFADMSADLIIGNYGRVQVYCGPKLLFYTDLKCLPIEILDAISNKLNEEINNKILNRIKQKTQKAKNQSLIDETSQ